MLNLEATFLLPQSQHIHIFIASQGNMILEVTVSQRRIVEFFFFFSFYHKEIIFSWKISKGTHHRVSGYWMVIVMLQKHLCIMSKGRKQGGDDCPGFG